VHIGIIVTAAVVFHLGITGEEVTGRHRSREATAVAMSLAQEFA
jgi:hypothetical protein